MSGGFRFVVCIGVFVGLSTQAKAVNNQLLNGNTFSAANVAPATLQCDDLCGIVVDNLKGELIGLDGGYGWGQADDQWCANHNVGTNPTVFASGVPTPSNAPRRAQCNVTLQAGDGSCEQVNRNLTHCKLHGSQIETQCLAYATTKEATKSEKVVLGFDVAATATCATACAVGYTGFGSGMIIACNVAGYAASGAEIIQNLTSKSSGMQKIVGSLGASVGAINTTRGIAQNGFNGARPVGTPGYNNTYTAEGMKGSYTVNYDAAGNQVSTVGNPEIQNAPTSEASVGNNQSTEASKKASKKNACIAAITFGALTGLRVYNMSQHVKTKQDACDAVQQLASQSFAPGFTIPTTADTSTTSGNAGASSGGTAASTGVSSSVRTTNAMLGSGDCTTPTCMTGTVDRTAGNGSAATDSGLLKSSGLSKLLANQAAALPLDKMLKHIENGGTADALINSALGGQGGAFGAGVAALAKQAQLDAASLAGTGLLGSTPMGGGGGMAGAGRAPGAEENPFKLMGQGDQNLGGGQNVNFTKGPALNGAEIGQDGDIYHASFSGSIFEIVSHKIQKTTDRVEPMNYSLPMNRAMSRQR